jgi:hypothetical protein
LSVFINSYSPFSNHWITNRTPSNLSLKSIYSEWARLFSDANGRNGDLVRRGGIGDRRLSAIRVAQGKFQIWI